jgi:exopolysaccharide production protein ExoQ
MSPSVALLAWLILLLALLRFDPAREPKSSLALWLPVIWLFFIGSRSPVLWLGSGPAVSAAQSLEQGNPLDRAIFSLFTVLAIAILVSRSFKWGEFFARNKALIAFLAFALLSVLWSDFPLATFKKWFRDMGVLMAVLVVLSDPRPLEAVRTVLRRLCYLLIPLSIVLIKYYPALGRTYGYWSGAVEYVGASTSKNMLGVLCLVSGIFFFWDTVTRWHDRQDARTKRILLINYAFIAMTLWLLHKSRSATSTICLVIGCLVIAAAHSRFGRRRAGTLKTLAPASFLVYLILTLGFGMGAQLSEAVGRSANMSDRTDIWHAVLRVPINPLLGTGYQSFWLGPRVQWVWSKLAGDNVLEAHNGYLEIYLDLGLIGLFLLCVFLVTSYREICRRLDSADALGSLGLGLWAILLFYNVTEAAFEGSLLWIAFLTVALVIPLWRGNRAHSPPSLEGVEAEEGVGFTLETAGQEIGSRALQDGWV